VNAQDAANNILVDLDAESERDLLSNAGTAPAGIAPFHCYNGVNKLFLRSLGTRPTPALGRKQQAVLSFPQQAVEMEQSGRLQNDGGTEIHDRDPLFTDEFLRTLKDVGVESVKLPPRSPNLNAHAERFVRSIKESCLERLVLFGQSSLRTAVQNFVAHYQTERNHQGLSNRLILPDPAHVGTTGIVQCRERLGGMLNYYYRAAA
jgi:hypothetical protein